MELDIPQKTGKNGTTNFIFSWTENIKISQGTNNVRTASSFTHALKWEILRKLCRLNNVARI